MKGKKTKKEDDLDSDVFNAEYEAMQKKLKFDFEKSQLSSEMKAEIWSEVNRKIERKTRKTIVFRRIVAVAASVAVILSVGMFVELNNSSFSDQKLLADINSNVTKTTEEIQIISGESQQKVTENAIIKNTAEGDIVVGEEKKIQAQEIKTEYVTIVVPRGKRSTVQFSDGTTAWINSGSKLTYPKEFDKKSRKVYLEGEMYIEVAKDEKRPFSVCTESLSVSVLGTKFNISAYGEEDVKSVVLVEGSVEVRKDKQRDKITPGQGYFEDKESTLIKPVDVGLYTSWKDGRMKMQDEPFEILMRKLSRYYGVKIQSDPNLNSHRLEGNLDLKESIDDIFHTLSLSKDFIYERENDFITVKHKNN